MLTSYKFTVKNDTLSDMKSCREHIQGPFYCHLVRITFFNRITIFLFCIFFTPKIAQKHKLHQSSALKCEIKGNVVVGMSDYNFESIPKKDHYLFKWVLTTEKACFFASNQALGIH